MNRTFGENTGNRNNVEGKLDFEGFTMQQMLAMNKYERLLIELGEKSYVAGDSKFPVELRLLFMLVINAALFLVGKLVLRNAGPAMSSVFGNIFGQQPVSGGGEAPRSSRRHMRGPSLNPEDLPEDD